jgi:hypothetical protein
MPLKVVGSEYFSKEWDPNSVDNLFAETLEIESFDAAWNRCAVGKVYPKIPKKKDEAK